MEITEDINFDKQLIPLLEPVINQSLDMIESILKSETPSSEDEVFSLLLDLEKNFGECKHLISPEIHGRIKSLNDKISKCNDNIESQEDNLE